MQAEIHRRLFEMMRAFGIHVRNFRVDCGSYSEGIVKIVMKHTDKFYIRAEWQGHRLTSLSLPMLQSLFYDAIVKYLLFCCIIDFPITVTCHLPPVSSVTLNLRFSNRIASQLNMLYFGALRLSMLRPTNSIGYRLAYPSVVHAHSLDSSTCPVQ